jgi:hypothetical protein
VVRARRSTRGRLELVPGPRVATLTPAPEEPGA